MKKGFTLIEIVVAVGLLAMVIGFSSVIFKVSIETRRTAGANAEIMQKLRAITNQLNRDFAGLRPDAPLMIWFEQDTNSTDPNRYDQIMFFADGDFQSTQLYDYDATLGFKVPATTGTPVVGNVARIYYGQASVNSASPVNFIYPWNQSDVKKRILGRRQHILTAVDMTATKHLDLWPDINDVVNSFDDDLVYGTKTYLKNELYEHDSLSLSQWKVVTNDPLKNDAIIATCLDNTNGRPQIDLVSQPPVGLHMLMTEGIGSFAVQWAYSCTASGGNTVYRWWPSIDPDGDPGTDDSDFDIQWTSKPQFGIYFNMLGGVTLATPDWSGPELARTKIILSFGNTFYPPALKFTFRIYDSKGIIKGGRTFTYIVYLQR